MYNVKHYPITITNPLKLFSQKEDKPRTNPSNNKSRGSYDINLDNPNYVKSLDSSFNIHENKTNLISFIMKNDLINIILKIPKYINESFGKCDLNLTLENKYHDKKWIVITILSDIEGDEASFKLDKLEDKLFEIYDDKIMDNILLSLEFE